MTLLPDDRPILGRDRGGQQPSTAVRDETSLYALAQHYRDRLLKEANLQQLVELPESVLRARIESAVGNMIREEGRTLTQAERSRLITFIVNEAVGYGPLQTLMQDRTITEIMVNGPDNIYVEQEGRLHRRTDVAFADSDHILHIIDRIVAPLGRRIDESSPMVDARLPDGSRVNAIIPPLSLHGPVLTIRRFRERPFTAEDLIRNGTMTPAMADFLQAAVRTKLSILVSGGTGSGKTTTLNVLASFIPHDERIITIEDSAELQFHLQHPHALRQESRPPNVEGEGEVPIRVLVRNALRMRPNRIVVGEVRGAEALDMLQAMNTGHEGSMTTVHANSPADAFSRLETMVLWAEGAESLPLHTIRSQLVSALDIVVHQERLPDGRRRIVRIAEVAGLDRDGNVALRDLFIYHYRIGHETHTVHGEFTATGYQPAVLARIHRAGIRLSPDVFRPAYKVQQLRQSLLSDDFDELLINGPSEIWIRRNGKTEQIASTIFEDASDLDAFLETILATAGSLHRGPDAIEARLEDGSELEALLPPLAPRGPIIRIRRYVRPKSSLAELEERGTLSRQIALVLESAVRSQLGIVICAASADTVAPLMVALAQCVPEERRIVLVQPWRRIVLQRNHVIELQPSQREHISSGSIDHVSALRCVLRLEPDHLVINELTVEEAGIIQEARRSKTMGILAGITADSLSEAARRVSSRDPSSPPMDALADIWLELGEVDGQPVVLNLAEWGDGQRGEPSLRNLISFDLGSRSTWRASNSPARLKRVLEDRGEAVPDGLFNNKQE